MDKFAQKQTHDACLSSREVLENLGYRVYDEHRDGNSSGSKFAVAFNFALSFKGESDFVLILLQLTLSGLSSFFLNF